MHAQQATRDAEAQQAQLTEVLRSALQQLGLALTPEKSPAPTPSGEAEREEGRQCMVGPQARMPPLTCCRCTRCCRRLL